MGVFVTSGVQGAEPCIKFDDIPEKLKDSARGREILTLTESPEHQVTTMDNSVNL